MKLDAASVPMMTSALGAQTRLVSQAGGLTQLGAHIETLPPGARSSERHWHSAEDEFLLVLDGLATVVDNDGAHLLVPGDAVAWRYGDPNGHHVFNRSTAPLVYLIVGSRVAEDVCSYPDSGHVQIHSLTEWKVVDAAGNRLRGGELPPELRNLPANWGKARDSNTPVQRFLPEATRVWVEEDDLSHPVLGSGLGPYRHAVLGDPGGLSQFGVHLEELPPGSASSFRHWHETEDEMVLILSGAAVLIEEKEAAMQPGDVACWPAGRAVGHCLANRGLDAVRYLVIGTRHQKDRVHYPDHDLIADKDGAARTWFHGDGRVRTV